MDMAALVAAVGTALDTLTGLRVYDFLAQTIAPPAAVVGSPTVTYDLTMGRGSDTAHIPIWIVGAALPDRLALAALAPWTDGTAVKAAVEDDPTLGGEAKTVRVVGAEIQPVNFNQVDYLAARFDVEVLG